MTRVIVILGPTCTGKSQVAMSLAEELSGEIINADALQVYKGLNLGTAKPTEADRRRVRHHLVDILSPDQAYSAGAFARDARALLPGIWEREVLPLVVGGSGLYLQTFLQGIGPHPPSDRSVRRRLHQRLAQKGLKGIVEELARKDPETARRLPPTDRQRILRAVEVWDMTGRSQSSWQEEGKRAQTRLEALRIGLTMPREVLYDRIAHRVRRMIEAGWVEEVARLLEAGCESTMPAFQAIGYRQIARHVEGLVPLEEAIGEIIQATRRYARRQTTWFRRDDKICWFTGGEGKNGMPDILAHVRAFLSRRSNDPT